MMIFIFCFISIIVADHCHSKPTVTDDDQLGPYFVENLIQPNLNRILYDPVRDASAPKVIAHGIVTDRNCVHLSGVQVDLWGADQDGSYESGLADGFMHGRNTVNQTGHFWFETILPARYNISATSTRPRHLHWRFKYGDHTLITQLYFAEDSDAPNIPSLAHSLVKMSGNQWIVEFPIVLDVEAAPTTNAPNSQQTTTTTTTTSSSSTTAIVGETTSAIVGDSTAASTSTAVESMTDSISTTSTTTTATAAERSAATVQLMYSTLLLVVIASLLAQVLKQ